MKPQDVSLTAERSSNIGPNFTTNHTYITLPHLCASCLETADWVQTWYQDNTINLHALNHSVWCSLYFVAIDTDLGVGLKIMGGVKCDRCLKLHAVITSVFASSKDHLHADIKEGKGIERWSGCMLLVGTPTMITELVVNLWSGRNQVHDHYRL